ncbi:asparagine synthase (glutamine-hydrolyzing) [Flavihumibacter sediminis]|nr:asparagine synthase (glutamine-hydrolyzing) [Flavihumibacter sediminis]
MCGIVGGISFSGSQFSESFLKTMTDSISHRGPDAEGFFSEGQVALGHRRLSILDLSSEANQPFSDHNNRWHIVYNGELYNFKDVKKSLGDIPWRTNSDTEVLVEALSVLGIDCLKLFKGMFAFAAWDRQEECLYLVRDRFGVKPLYYYINDDMLLFASEIRAILRTKMVNPNVDLNSIAQFLRFQSVGGEQTIIKGIRQLPAGHFLKVSNKKISVHSYWDITKPSEKFDFSNRKGVLLNIKKLLSESVTQRLISDVPIGAFLSGGIDSSAIVGLMAEASRSRPVTFNVSFNDAEFDESHYAQIVSKKYNTLHHTVKLNAESLLDSLPDALNAMDTPSGDGPNTYVVSKAVRNAGLTVALSGIGGDELFAGYPFFIQFKKLRENQTIWNNSYMVRKLISSVMPQNKWHSVLETNNADISNIYPLLREILSRKAINNILQLKTSNDDDLQKLLKRKQAEIETFPVLGHVSIAEYLGYTQQTLLKDTDQMSMAVSLEVREPFFDHELVEYVLQVPDFYKFPKFPKSLLVESLDGLLPDEIVHRRKQGFTFPWKHWLKNDLESFCSFHLKNIGERSFINSNEVQNKWKRFKQNDPTINWMEIWLLVILEYWLNKNSIEAET